MNNMLTYDNAKDTLTPAEKVGQFFMPAAFINDTETEIRQLENLIKKHHIGGICIFHSRASAATNFEEKKEITYNEKSLGTLKKLIERYQSVSRYPLLVSIDAEWGLAMRIENTPKYPYAITLGAIKGNTDLVFEVGKNIARDCKYAGIHWNLAPVVDINNNPDNPVIGYRSFGEDKHLVAEKAIAFVKGTQSEGILTCAKHFPGHGDTATDSHLGLPIIGKTKKSLMGNELYPFQELINNGVDAVMVGHLAVPSLTGGKSVPATISKEMIKGILRKELNFKGVVVSDALNMHSVSKLFSTKGELEWLAFNAGNDVLCFAENVAEGIETILQNAQENQIGESFERVWKLKEKAISNSIENHGEVLHMDTLNKKLALVSLTFHKGNENTISKFKKEGFIGIAIGKDTNNVFFKSILKERRFSSFSTLSNTIEEIKAHSKKGDNVLLALFLPKVKPTGNFGVTDTALEFINDLAKTRNVVLYVFGNPYFLNALNIEKAKAVLLAYQDFEIFQQNAGQHFLGKIDAKGKLPVSIHQQSV